MKVKFLIAAFAVSMLLNLAQPAYSQEGSRQIKTQEGEVTSLDWVGDTFGLKWYPDPQSSVYNEAVFTISSDTKVIRGSETATSLDVEEGDHAVVNYYIDDNGVQVAKSIMLLSD